MMSIHFLRKMMDGAPINELLLQTPHEKSSAENSTDVVGGVIPMDELIAWATESGTYSRLREWAITRGTSGITSMIASCILVWMIMRSHERLSTTQHRLLLGICICDIMFSLSLSFFNAMIPSDDNYFVWNARGNQTTCNIQGLLQTFGGLGGQLYNCALNVYFLSIVKYNKSDKFIRNKIEPFLHGLPIVATLTDSVLLISKKQYNHDGAGFCGSPIHLPPHCQGYDIGGIREGFEIPCYRGVEGALTRFIVNMVSMFIPFIVITVSLGMIYKTVRTQEKKLAKYGVGALDLDHSPTASSPQHDLQQPTNVWDRISTSLIALSNSLKSCPRSYKKRDRKPVRTNEALSKSRAVLFKAFGFSFAWFLTWGAGVAIMFVFLVTGVPPLVLQHASAVFIPLGGLFNLLIFMYPRIIAAKKRSKRGEETISWRQACVKAFWSRGKGGKKRGGSSKIHPKKTTDNTDMTTTSNDDGTPPQEEERCEIQKPDNLHSSDTNIIGSP